MPVYDRASETVVDKLFWNTVRGPSACLQPDYVRAIRAVNVGDVDATGAPDVKWLHHRVVLLVC